MTDTEAELARLRLTVAKVREVYAALRRTEVDGKLCRVIANAIEDALIDADYEAAEIGHRADCAVYQSGPGGGCDCDAAAGSEGGRTR